MPDSVAFPSDLTPRQRDVFALLRRGLRYNQVAEELGISVHTVKTHVQDIAEKLPGEGIDLQKKILIWRPDEEVE